MDIGKPVAAAIVDLLPGRAAIGGMQQEPIVARDPATFPVEGDGAQRALAGRLDLKGFGNPRRRDGRGSLKLLLLNLLLSCQPSLRLLLDLLRRHLLG